LILQAVNTVRKHDDVNKEENTQTMYLKEVFFISFSKDLVATSASASSAALAV